MKNVVAGAGGALVGAGEKPDRVLAYTADPDGAQGGSSSYSNYYV